MAGTEPGGYRRRRAERVTEQTESERDASKGLFLLSTGSSGMSHEFLCLPGLDKQLWRKEMIRKGAQS